MSPHSFKTVGNVKKRESVSFDLYLLFLSANWFLEIHTKNKRPHALDGVCVEGERQSRGFKGF